MIAAQYEIGLPTDYDMAVIRRRVAERGSGTDDMPGLGLKAYLVREVSNGSPVNAYAPFYLWNSPVALGAFHWGGLGFGGIVRDFGRPAVRTWIGGTFHRGGSYFETPAYATRSLRPMPADTDPQLVAERLDEKCVGLAMEPGVHSLTWAVDPAGWQAVIFRLSALAPAPGTESAAYQVLHLSAPGMDDL